MSVSFLQHSRNHTQPIHAPSRLIPLRWRVIDKWYPLKFGIPFLLHLVLLYCSERTQPHTLSLLFGLPLYFRHHMWMAPRLQYLFISPAHTPLFRCSGTSSPYDKNWNWLVKFFAFDLSDLLVWQAFSHLGRPRYNIINWHIIQGRAKEMELSCNDLSGEFSVWADWLCTGWSAY